MDVRAALKAAALKAVVAVVLAGIVMLGVSMPSAGGQAAATSATSIAAEQAFVAHINAVRVANGIAPLQVDPRLTALGRQWASRMAAAGRISHNARLPRMAPREWVRLGENVGVGRTGVDPIHQAFVGSPKHYRNLVNRRFQTVGVGVVEAHGRLWVVEQFMRSARR